MSEYTIGSITDLPPASRIRTGLRLAMQNLAKGQAIFVPAREGESLQHLAIRLHSNIQAAQLNRRVSIRRDSEKNGYWLYWREDLS